MSEVKGIEAHEIVQMSEEAYGWFERTFQQWFHDNPNEDLICVIPNPLKNV